MIRTILTFLAGAALAAGLLVGCASRPGFEDEGLPTAPQLVNFDLVQAFVGRHKAWGVFQDRLGTVRRSFVVDVIGSWDGETLTLEEDFVWEDGSTERRVWELTPTGENNWTGTAEGVEGTPQGRVMGPVFNWSYEITLKTPDGDLFVAVDDWIWQLGEGVLLNKGYVSKYGIDIGELLIFFYKLPE